MLKEIALNFRIVLLTRIGSSLNAGKIMKVGLVVHRKHAKVKSNILYYSFLSIESFEVQ